MNTKYQVSVLTDEPNRDVAVLRIAAATKNTVCQFYQRRVQVSPRSIEALHRKILSKLSLHQIENVKVGIALQFRSDKTVTFDSLEAFSKYDFSTDLRSQVVTLKWSFIFDSSEDGPHLHSVYVRLAERPHPGLMLQRMLSGQVDDVDNFDQEATAAAVCKIDFVDSRFSSEILALVTEWVASCPMAEATFGAFNYINRHESSITSFIYGTLPAIAVLGYVGVWLGLVPETLTNSTKFAAAWILGGGVIFLASRYIAQLLNGLLSRHLARICDVPVFQITSGDANRMTEYLARSHASMLKLGGSGLIYGAFKAIGLYFSTYIARAFL